MTNVVEEQEITTVSLNEDYSQIKKVLARHGYDLPKITDAQYAKMAEILGPKMWEMGFFQWIEQEIYFLGQETLTWSMGIRSDWMHLPCDPQACE